MKNWKSTLSFFIFVGVYLYAVVNKDSAIVETTGFVALYSSLFMMLRSQMTTTIIEKIFEKINFK
tara:strand:+ start:7950 stop:8144 length:195 start_codon:yes stop_codon:yes gene_type:complete